jgi:hypothetical protein
MSQFLYLGLLSSESRASGKREREQAGARSLGSCYICSESGRISGTPEEGSYIRPTAESFEPGVRHVMTGVGKSGLAKYILRLTSGVVTEFTTADCWWTRQLLCSYRHPTSTNGPESPPTAP